MIIGLVRLSVFRVFFLSLVFLEAQSFDSWLCHLGPFGRSPKITGGKNTHTRTPLKHVTTVQPVTNAIQMLSTLSSTPTNIFTLDTLDVFTQT